METRKEIDLAYLKDLRKEIDLANLKELRKEYHLGTRKEIRKVYHLVSLKVNLKVEQLGKEKGLEMVVLLVDGQHKGRQLSEAGAMARPSMIAPTATNHQ